LDAHRSEARNRCTTQVCTVVAAQVASFASGSPGSPSKGEHVLRFEAIVPNTKQLGGGRVLEKFPRILTRLAPGGFTAAGFTTQVRAATGRTGADYTTRQGAYDLRELRGERLVAKPGRSLRYQVPNDAARPPAHQGVDLRTGQPVVHLATTARYRTAPTRMVDLSGPTA
jgi:hypothetical protein